MTTGGPGDELPGDDDDLAGRLQAKMTELRARQALRPERILSRSIDELAVRLDSHARLLELNTRILQDHTHRLQALYDLVQARPSV